MHKIFEFWISKFYSNFNSSPSDLDFLLRVEVGWVWKLALVIFGIESLAGIIGDLEEIGQMLLVGEILIQIIFKMLNHVHVLLNEIVIPDPGEWKCFII